MLGENEATVLTRVLLRAIRMRRSEVEQSIDLKNRRANVPRVARTREATFLCHMRKCGSRKGLATLGREKRNNKKRFATRVGGKRRLVMRGEYARLDVGVLGVGGGEGEAEIDALELGGTERWPPRSPDFLRRQVGGVRVRKCAKSTSKPAWHVKDSEDFRSAPLLPARAGGWGEGCRKGGSAPNSSTGVTRSLGGVDRSADAGLLPIFAALFSLLRIQFRIKLNEFYRGELKIKRSAREELTYYVSSSLA